MTKLTLSDLTNLANEASVVSLINDNNALIEAALENTLSRDGSTPNPMEADLDLNSYRIYNLVAAISATEPVRKAEFDALSNVVDEVYNDTLTLYTDFSVKFLGSASSPPSVDNNGGALAPGALYFNTTSNRMNVYSAEGWVTVGATWYTGSGAPSNDSGANGDLYLRSNGDLYQKSSGSWGSVLFSLKGETGTPGSSVSIIGSLANSGLLPGSGTLGQGYLITGNLWVWTGSSWTNVGAIQGPQGPAGLNGNNGTNGTNGATGTAGAPGSKIYSGSGAPNNIDYTVGDWYINTTTSDVYEKTGASAWTLRVNIKGATGNTGATGSAGSNGSNGSNGTNGKTWFADNGVPGTGVGVIGDFYLNLDNSDIYEKTDVATWTSIGSFKGVTGDTGATGSAGAAGETGRPAGVKYTYDSTVTKVDPGTGNVRFNSATASSVTEIYIDNTDADSNSVTAWIDSFDDSTTTANRGTLFYRANNSGTIGIYQVNGSVVDETGYRTIPVSYIAGTLPANTNPVYFVFNRTGNVGATGSGSGDMSKSVYDPNDDGKVTSAVNADVVPWSGISSKPTTLSGFGITDGQPLDNELTALAGLTSAANKLPYFTGAGTAAVTDLTTVGRNLIDDATVADQRTTLGLGALAVKSSIATADIDADAVTYAKIQNVSATDRILGRSTAGAGDIEEITCTSAARSILDDTTTAAIATTLGLGTASSPQFTGVELGHATDTTLSRSAAGVLAVEGNVVPSPASQAHGDILFRNASSWSRLAAGTSGQYLKTLGAGAAPIWDTVSAGGMTLLGTIDTSSGSSAKSLTSLTLTDYKEIVLVWIGVSHDSSNSSADLQVSDGTASYIVAQEPSSSASVFNGVTLINLENGVLQSVGYYNASTTYGVNEATVAGGTGGARLAFGRTRHTTAFTSVTIDKGVASNWDAGSVKVYGVK